jgi:hypothetical protein
VTTEYIVFAQELVASHRREARAWTALVGRAQSMPKTEKEAILGAVADLNLAAAARFARHAGVGGVAVDRVLCRAMRELDASSIGWVVEDLLGALGERKMLDAFRRASEQVTRSDLGKAAYWARGHLSAIGREDLDRLIESMPPAEPSDRSDTGD